VYGHILSSTIPIAALNIAAQPKITAALNKSQSTYIMAYQQWLAKTAKTTAH